MLRSCVCVQGGDRLKRRNSTADDASSCCPSETEQIGAKGQHKAINPPSTSRSYGLKKLFPRMGWLKHFRRPHRGMSGTKAEKSIRAAIFIQKWYRQHQARQEMRKRCNWQIFQNLEYASEQDQSELYKFFSDLMKHMPQAVGTGNKSTHSSSILEDHNVFVEEECDISSIKIEFPLNKNHIENMIDVFRKKRRNLLHPKYVALILREAASSLKKMPNLSMVSTAVSQQVTVCGDLHGKLDDLLVVFYKNGMPSTCNPYVFNGDYVDRGKKGLEVLLLLLSLHLTFPNTVFLNRGNHEDSVMNMRYGFSREVEAKYPHNYKRLLMLIDEVYRWLPLGSLLNNRVLVVHGGFADSTDLEYIKTIDRGKYVSILRPPLRDSEHLDKAEWQQIFDIMWSDPQAAQGCKPNSLRGAGVWFGPDITEEFLNRHQLKYVIRSHECKPNGYEFMHDKKIITLFSASNYYAMGSNTGAYIQLNNQLMPHFVQYISAASQTNKLSFKQRIGIIESAALKELAVRMREHRSELETEFMKCDPNETGLIANTKWCNIMERVTKLGLPWRLLRDKLAPGSDSQHVNYIRTLDFLDTDVIVDAEADGTNVLDALYSNKTSLETIFNIIDADNSGEITLDEFEKAIDLLIAHIPGVYSKVELVEKCLMMDLNGDGKVDLNEFLEAFRLSNLNKKQQKKTDKKKRTTARAPSELVTELANKITRNTVEVEHDIDPTDFESKIVDPK